MAPKAEKGKKYNQGIRSYHEIGPLADLSDAATASRLIGAVSETLLPEVVSPKERVLQWQRNIMNPTLYVDQVSDPVIAGDVVSAYKDIGDSCESLGQAGTARMLYEASLVVAGSRIDRRSSGDLLSVNEVRDWLLVRGYRETGSETGISPTHKRRIEVFNKILAERGVSDGGLKDGPAFEMALMAILQYDQYSSEDEGAQNFTRMARTREDMPARGMPPEVGTRVAHDVVYVREGHTYRIQAKSGADAGDAAAGRYDNTRIVEIVEENMDSADLTEVFNTLIRAYNDDSEASTAILQLAEKYKSRILKSRTYASGKVLELVNA